MIERSIYKHLLEWKNRVKRKTLLLRGARQIGKTYIIRQFGKEFENFIEINFIEQPGVKTLFTDLVINPDSIINNISAFMGTPIDDGKTLLFFDEIQACPEAITALRFFYEKRPDLHLQQLAI